MKRALLPCVIFLGLVASCSEKCPLEPCDDWCGVAYGVLEPPAGAVFAPPDLRIRTLTSSCRLNRDLSFCLPDFPGTGTGVVVVTASDSVPVMLGYVFPQTVRSETGEQVPLELDAELNATVRTGSGGVKISTASTALTLVMLNPFLGGATVEERAWFASRILGHSLFTELAEQMKTALASSPAAIFDRETHPGLYERATTIITDLIRQEGKGLGEASRWGPYVENALGDDVALINPKFVDYGVTVGPYEGAGLDTVFLLPARGVDWLARPAAVNAFLYPLGEGRFKVGFYKGFEEFPIENLLDREHPGGLATISNSERTIWYTLTVFVGLPESRRSGIIGPSDADWVAALREAILAQGMPETVDLALAYLYSNPEELSGWLQDEVSDVPGVMRFVGAAGRILGANAEYIGASDVRVELLFYGSLFTPVCTLIESVCQRHGTLFPCENPPMLTDAAFSPTTGYTDTVFTFSVRYRDIEGQPPASIAVVIDDVRYDLTLVAGEAGDGLYQVSTELPPGPHGHYFECIDTNGDGARLPAVMFIYGPVVLSYPKLRWGGVRPLEGTLHEEYEYAVHYSDGDFDPPDYVRVVTDGGAHAMSLASGRSYDGTYRCLVRLPAGRHMYHFECADTAGASGRDPQTGDLIGPTVNHAPILSNGAVYPASGPTTTLFKFEVDYNHSNGLPPDAVAVFIDGNRRNMTLKTGTPENGTYCVETYLALGLHKTHFIACDTAGSTDRLPRSGEWSAPLVHTPEGRNPDAKVAVHVRAHRARAGCDYGDIEFCSDIVTTAEGFSIDAFPVFFDLTEYRGVDYGLTWPAWTYSAAFYNCSDVVAGEIGHPGDGASHIWIDCHQGVAVPAYLWLYADGPGMICPCDHPGSGAITVTDCGLGVNEPMMIFCAGVYGAVGDDPCPP